MTSDDHCPPANTRMYNIQCFFRKLKISFYCAHEVFLPFFLLKCFFCLFTSSLLCYFAQKALMSDVFGFFLYLHADEQ